MDQQRITTELSSARIAVPPRTYRRGVRNALAVGLSALGGNRDRNAATTPRRKSARTRVLARAVNDLLAEMDQQMCSRLDLWDTPSKRPAAAAVSGGH